MLDDRVGSIINKYREKTGFKDRARFLYNARSLIPSKTLAEVGIINNSVIFVISIEDLYGGFMKKI